MAIASYSHVVSVDPVIEPVTVEEAKRNCDVSDNFRDADFARWITEARKKVEADCRRSFITQTHVLKLDAFPNDDYLELLYPPAIAISSVQYVDTGGTTQTFASGNYSIDTNRTPSVLLLGYAKVWPTPRGQRNAVTVTYTAGYGAAASAVPEAAKSAILLLVKHRYEHPAIVEPGTWRDVGHGYNDLVCSSPLYWGDYP